MQILEDHFVNVFLFFIFMVLLQMPFAMGFCLFKGDFGEIVQPHPYTTTRLIFLVR